MHQSPGQSSSSVRRSKRLLKEKPEFKGLEDLENNGQNTPRRNENDSSSSLKFRNGKSAQHRNQLDLSEETDTSSNEDIIPIEGNYQEEETERTALMTEAYPSRFRETEGYSSRLRKQSSPLKIFNLPELVTTPHSNAVEEANTVPNLERENCCWFFWSFLLIVLIVLIVFFTVFLPRHDENNELPLLFRSQSKELRGMVHHGMKSTDPFVVLLIHNDQDDLATCLAKHIFKSIVTARTKGSVEPIIIEARNETIKPNFLENLKLQVEGHHGFLLLHLEDLPAELAIDLHFILDVHTPWLPEGIYILTLKIPVIGSQEIPFSAVQRILSEKWSQKIKPDNFAPLITRIGNFVSVVKPDEDLCKDL